MPEPQINLERLEQAKKHLNEIFEEVLLWLDETREDTCYGQLFDYSLPAAELAAILGFAQPPFEHVTALPAAPDRQEDLRFPEIRVNPPTGMSPLHFRFTEESVETRVREASPRFYDDMRSFVMRWMRALARLDIRVVKPSECVVAMYDESAEALIFHEQHERELRGDARSFLQEVQAESLKGLRLAKLYNLSPEQTATLQRDMARSWAGATRSNQPVATARGETRVEASVRMPVRAPEAVESLTSSESADTDPVSARRAERISRDEANRKARELLDADPTFRDKGQRKWARQLDARPPVCFLHRDEFAGFRVPGTEPALSSVSLCHRSIVLAA